MRGASFSHLAKLGRSGLRPYTIVERGQIGVVAMAIEACGAMAALVRGSIDETVPTHAAAAPAINFALRSS